jgi:hypothetical protein
MEFKELMRKCSGIELTLEHSLIAPLIPWTEYVGSIAEIRDNSLILEVKERILMPVSYSQLKEAGVLTRNGDEIGILVLEDGKIRVRNITEYRKIEGDDS